MSMKKFAQSVMIDLENIDNCADLLYVTLAQANLEDSSILKDDEELLDIISALYINIEELKTYVITTEETLDEYTTPNIETEPSDWIKG